jgi:hypothetical protein
VHESDGLQLPRRSSATTAAFAGFRGNNSNLPIIAASGFMFGGSCPEMPDFDAMVAEAGATGSLYRPFRPEQLLQAIQTAIGVTT